MNWLFVSIIAQFVLATGSIFDKMLLKKKIFDPWVYTFWVGVLGVVSFALIPFGFPLLSLYTTIIALISGFFFTLALLFLFLALEKGEASGILPAVGVLSPLFTLIVASWLLQERLGTGELLGFFLLVFAGLILVNVGEKGSRVKTLFLITISSFAFGIANVLTKIVFQGGPFISGFIWIKIGGIIFVLLWLLSPPFRKNVFATAKLSSISYNIWYLLNRLYAALGGLALHFAIFLSHPALVDATQSLRYIIIFFAGWIILRERFRGIILWGKIVASIFIIIGFMILGLSNYSKNLPPINPDRPISWGVTFSQKFSQNLGLDWKENFQAILTDLKPSKMRLVAYWDEIEKEKGKYNFDDLDWQIKRAEEAGVGVILALGMKVPRWPECYIPRFAREIPISKSKFPNELEEHLVRYMEEVIIRYKNNPVILVWQIENEPFLRFGICPDRGDNFMEKEIELVKKLDPSRPVLITDGGELGLWFRSASKGDIFGTTMYRKVYPGFLGPYLGVLEYPIAPNFFRVKEKIIRYFLNEPHKKFIVVELQAEPWGPVEIKKLDLDQQMKIFGIDYFRDTIQFARDTGFEEYYLWGAEWWYWLKQKYGDDSFWNEARNIMKNS